MSLKVRIEARLKALFAGVGLSKKSVQAEVERLAALLTDESTDEDIDAKLNERNAILPYADQKKHDDYLAGKEAKEKADREAARLKALAEGKTPDPDDVPADTPEWAKAFMKAQKEEAEALKAEIASIKGEKVANTRREQYIKALEGTSKTYQDRELKKFDRMAFKTDDEFTEFLEEAKTFASDAVQEDVNGDLGVDRPAGGNGNPDSKIKVSDAEIDTLADAIL